MIALCLAVALLVGVGAVVAPNPIPLVVICLFALFWRQNASERCNRGH